MSLRFGSVCSGIEAASVAWEPLGFTPAWFAEIEPFPNAVLAHHWPKVPNLGDITSADFIERARSQGHIDVLVGGTPCQGFSIAGHRGGIRDKRSALALNFIEIAKALRPTWVVWENVPGCLTTAGGRDFGAFVGKVAELGYRWAYRVLDAQFFGIPQRRRRVFLVGSLGGGRPERVLFEQDGEGRHSQAGGQKEQGTAGTTAPGSGTVSAACRVFSNSGSSCWSESVGTQSARDHKDGEGQGLVVCVHSAAYIVHGEHSTAMRGNGNAQVAFETERARCLDTTGGYATNQGDTLVLTTQESFVVWQQHGTNVGPMGTLRKGDGGLTSGVPFVAVGAVTVLGDRTHALTAEVADASEDRTRRGQPIVADENLVVRRLTPRECERLMGFPDDHTFVTYRKKPAKDGPRYKSLGNSIAVPVLRWIGARLLAESLVLYDRSTKL